MFVKTALIAETGKLQKFAFRLTRNKDDADDLVQSTCLRALEKSSHFEDGTNLFSWTSKIMFNLFVSGYRRRVKYESSSDPQPHLDMASSAPEQESVTELSQVRVAMASLSVDHREIIILICVKGMRYSEVSEVLNIPIGTVRSRLARAREHLQIIMNPPPSISKLQRLQAAHPANTNVPVIPAYIASRALQSR